MSNILQRILTFFVVIPALILIILFVPYKNYLFLNIIVVLCSFGLAFESARVVGLYPIPNQWRRSNKMIRFSAIMLLGTAAPLIALGLSLRLIDTYYIPAILALIVLVLFSSQVFHVEFNQPDVNVLEQILRYVFLLVYPGAGLAYLIMIAMLPDASYLILTFLGLVFINDSAAYVFGMLLGRFSHKPLRISPNKTMIGFIGGFSASIIVCWFAWFLQPQLFPYGGVWSALGIGAIGGFGVIIGDLFESALKRSSGLKDSGSVIPGRGGLLDSLDSLVFSAPLFYYLYLVTQRPYLLSL